MAIDPDAFRAASMLITEYGENAPTCAENRVRVLLDVNEATRAAAWYQIKEATEELLRSKPVGGEAVH